MRKAGVSTARLVRTSLRAMTYGNEIPEFQAAYSGPRGKLLRRYLHREVEQGDEGNGEEDKPVDLFKQACQ